MLLVYVSVHSPFYIHLYTDRIITNQELGLTIYANSYTKDTALGAVWGKVFDHRHAWYQTHHSSDLSTTWASATLSCCIVPVFTLLVKNIGLSRIGLQICQDD